jgi:hypothetical protein
MGVHAGPVVLEQGLGHEGDGVVVAVGHVFQDILEPHELIAHFQQGLEAHVDFGLARRGHFVVLALHVDAQAFQNQQHFGPEVLELVRGRNGEVALFVARFVPRLGSSSRPVFQAPSMESIS